MAQEQDMSLGLMVRLLAAKLAKANTQLPFKNQVAWHELFYALKSEDREGRPKFLDELVFDWDSPYPRCEELSDFLNALHVTANVSAHNPHYEVITVAEGDVDRWSKDLDGFDDQTKAFVQKAAEIAQQEFQKAA
jgi:hypothetical protein